MAYEVAYLCSLVPSLAITRTVYGFPGYVSLKYFTSTKESFGGYGARVQVHDDYNLVSSLGHAGYWLLSVACSICEYDLLT